MRRILAILGLTLIVALASASATPVMYDASGVFWNGAAWVTSYVYNVPGGGTVTLNYTGQVNSVANPNPDTYTGVGEIQIVVALPPGTPTTTLPSIPFHLTVTQASPAGAGTFIGQIRGGIIGEDTSTLAVNFTHTPTNGFVDEFTIPGNPEYTWLAIFTVLRAPSSPPTTIQAYLVEAADDVPEPASMVLFGSGLIGVAFLSRRALRKR